MRKNKISKELFPCHNMLIVEPNNALTPREILHQFGQGFTSSFKEPTDDIYDDRYSDEDLVDRVCSFEDEFEAMDLMNQPMYPINDGHDERSADEAVKSEQAGQSSSEQGDQ